MPQIDTFSIVVGTEACNARCPFCVARMTSNEGVDKKAAPIHTRNLEKACLYAERHNVSTVLLTSKGEPTLWPDLIGGYLKIVGPRFPIIELQTNGLLITQQELHDWYRDGLTIVSISISHYDREANRQIYTPHKASYPDLKETVKTLHDVGFTVRFSCVMSDGMIDSWSEVQKLVRFTQNCEAEQLTIRPVNRPQTDRDLDVLQWVDEHRLSKEKLTEIEAGLETQKRLLRFGYGGCVYDVNGQNVCLTNSLTIDHEKDQMRQIIFYPDGHLRYDWTYNGAIIF